MSDGDLEQDVVVETPPQTQDETPITHKLWDKLLEYGDGLEPADLPRAILIHEGLGLGIALATFGACYALEPARRLAPTSWSERFQAEFAKRFPKQRGKQVTKVAVAFAEQAVIRQFARPVFIPLKLVLTARAIAILKT